MNDKLVELTDKITEELNYQLSALGVKLTAVEVKGLAFSAIETVLFGLTGLEEKEISELYEATIPHPIGGDTELPKFEEPTTT